MAPPVAVYVVAAIIGVAAAIVFKDHVYEPHIAPALESWAEGFLEQRRRARNRRASAVPVSTSRRRRDSSSSSRPSHHNTGSQTDRARDGNEGDGAAGQNDPSAENFELEALGSTGVDKWRNDVRRSQESATGLRQRRKDRPMSDFDGFASTTTSLDESFASLTHTPLASTHVISNVSSPITPSTPSLPLTPSRYLRSESRSTTTQGDVDTLFAAPSSPSRIHELPMMSPRMVSPGSVEPTPHRPPTDSTYDLDTPTATSPLTLPDTAHRSPAAESIRYPLPFTPTYQVIVNDSPFGPLLPDTPRSSAEMYGERPFSPIARVMGSSSASGTFSSRANSMSSTRTLGSSRVPRRGSGLVNGVVTSGSDDSNDEAGNQHTSNPEFTLANSGTGTAGFLTVSSLSERYPAAPTPPVVVSPPTSSVGIISPPSSPRSGGSEVVIDHVVIPAVPRSPFRPHPQTLPSIPTLQLPPDTPSPRLRSRPQSSTSSSLSYASFLSPLPVSRVASESEGDEFLSVSSDDSEWGASPVTPSGRAGPVLDSATNPFLHFGHTRRDVGGGGSQHWDESEGSEGLVSNLGHEGESEVGSDESWGSARRH